MRMDHHCLASESYILQRGNITVKNLFELKETTNFKVFGHLICMSSSQEDWWSMVSAFIVSMIVFALPLVFGLFSRYVETYSNARHRNYVDLIRSFLLIIVVMAMVIYSYFHKDHEGSCWENDLGQEIYRFNVFFPLCLVLQPFIVESIYGLIYSR